MRRKKLDLIQHMAIITQTHINIFPKLYAKISCCDQDAWRLKQEGALLGATEATVVYIIGSRVAQAT